MSSTITATFEIAGWDEQPVDEAVGVGKLTQASVSKHYSGDVDGSSATEWLMAYHPKTAAFVGIERIKGTIDGKHGTLVLQHVGTFEDGTAKADLTIIDGTDELKGVKGSGTLVADPGGKVTLTLDL